MDRLPPAFSLVPLCLAAAAAGWFLGRLGRKKPAARAAPAMRQAQNGGPLAAESCRPAAKLRRLLAEGENIIVMPCCYDGLTARLIERAGFQLTFMTGFGVSASHGFADCQLVSYQEMLETAFRICSDLASLFYSRKDCKDYIIYRVSLGLLSLFGC